MSTALSVCEHPRLITRLVIVNASVCAINWRSLSGTSPAPGMPQRCGASPTPGTSAGYGLTRRSTRHG